MSVTVEIGTTQGGITELTRHWEAEDPWASLVIVHGIAEHSGRYDAVGQLFADAGIDTRSFDLVGFGASGGHRAYVERWSTYLDQVLDNLAPAFNSGLPTVLLGHSLGGLIAATYALSRHRLPALMVLSSPALEANVPCWQRKAAPVLSNVLPKFSIPNPVKAEQLCHDEAVEEKYFSDPLVHRKTTARLGNHMFEQIRHVAASHDAYNVRTLIYHGGEDTLVPPEVSESLAELPHVDRVLYPELRHECLNEPEGPEVVGDVIDWLRAEVASQSA